MNFDVSPFLTPSHSCVLASSSLSEVQNRTKLQKIPGAGGRNQILHSNYSKLPDITPTRISRNEMRKVLENKSIKYNLQQRFGYDYIEKSIQHYTELIQAKSEKDDDKVENLRTNFLDSLAQKQVANREFDRAARNKQEKYLQHMLQVLNEKLEKETSFDLNALMQEIKEKIPHTEDSLLKMKKELRKLNDFQTHDSINIAEDIMEFIVDGVFTKSSTTEDNDLAARIRKDRKIEEEYNKMENYQTFLDQLPTGSGSVSKLSVQEIWSNMFKNIDGIQGDTA